MMQYTRSLDVLYRLISKHTPNVMIDGATDLISIYIEDCTNHNDYYILSYYQPINSFCWQDFEIYGIIDTGTGNYFCGFPMEEFEGHTIFYKVIQNKKKKDFHKLFKSVIY